MKFTPPLIPTACVLAGLLLLPGAAAPIPLPVAYYDFLGEDSAPSMGRVVHPDFNLTPRQTPTPGLVQPLLSGPGPRFLSSGGTASEPPQLTTAENFSSWYVSDPNYNLLLWGTLIASPSQWGHLQFQYPEGFFPLDGQGLGNTVTTGHNHHFTLTYQWRTVYLADQPNLFEFASDDDLWVFINGKLWVDLGGMHSAGSSRVIKDLNEDAASLGLRDGRRYTYQLFFAERHTGQSGLVATLPQFNHAVPETPAGTPLALLGGAALLSWVRSRRSGVESR